MERNRFIELIKDPESVQIFMNNFSKLAIERYEDFHKFIKLSDFKFEIQNFHDIVFFPLKYSEMKNIGMLIEDYLISKPELISVFNEFVSSGLDQLYSAFSEIEMSHLNGNNKAEALTLISNSINDYLILIGVNSNKNETLIELNSNLHNQISNHQTPSKKLTPRFDTFFYQNMLMVLVENGLIIDFFKNPTDRLNWVNSAFYFGIKDDTTIKNSIINLNWVGSTKKLADFLLFLFYNLIDYKFKNKREFYNWIFIHVQIQHRKISKSSKDLRTLKTYFKNSDNYFSSNYRLSDDNLFENGIFYPPKLNS